MGNFPVSVLSPRFACLTVALLGVPGAAMAQHSVVVPLEMHHSSNPALTSDAPVGVVRFRVSPQYTIENQDGANLNRFSFGGVLERSSNTAVSAHRSDPNLSFELQRASPAGDLGLRVALSQASTREEAFSETGVVVSDATQRNVVLAGTLARNLSDVSRVELGLGANEVSYDTPRLVDSREFRSSVRFSRDLREDMQVMARWEGSRLRPDQGVVRSSRNSLGIGLSSRLSEAVRLVAEVGTVRTSGLVSSSDPATLLRLEYTGERLSSTLEWARSSTAFGATGGYAATRVLGWTAEYPLSERTSVNLSAAHTRSQGAGGAAGSNWTAGVRHALGEFWSVEGRLGQLRSRPSTGGSASANLVGLLLTYSHPDF